MNCICTELRSYLKTTIFSAAACFVIYSGVVNAQTLILSVDDSCWTRQDLPGAYMSVEAPVKLKDGLKTAGESKANKMYFLYENVLIIFNAFASYTEFPDSISLDIDDQVQRVINSMGFKYKQINPNEEFEYTIDTVNNNIEGRIVSGNTSIENIPLKAGFITSIYVDKNKIWALICFYVENSINKGIAERIINSVEIEK